jgi:hypothetical protein
MTDDVRRSPFHRALHPLETPDRTFGCRRGAPESCKTHRTATCAFFRGDGLCLSPPLAWKRQYEKLASERDGET